MKKLAIILTLFLLPKIICFAQNIDVINAYNLQGKQYFEKHLYTDSINSYRSALNLESINTHANAGIINSYLARATYYYNKKRDFNSCIDDLKSALFYLKYSNDFSSTQLSKAIQTTEANLNDVIKQAKKDTSSKGIFEEAKRLKKEGKLEAAATTFHYALSDSKYQMSSYFEIANIFYVLNNLDKAKVYYEKVLSYDKNHSQSLLKLGKIYETLGDKNIANNFYTKAMNGDIDDIGILNKLYLDYQNKIKQNPKDYQSLINIGAVCQKMNKFDEALKYYNLASKYEPPSTNISKINIGSLYMNKKDYQNALKIYNEILSKSPNNHRAQFLRALCYEKLNKYQEAIKDYKACLANNPDNNEAKENLDNLLMKNLNSNDLITFLKQKLNKTPNDPDLNYQIGYELHKQKQPKEALYYYKRSIELGKNDSNTYLNLSKALYECGNLKDSLDLAKRAQNKFPDDKNLIAHFNELYNVDLNNQILQASKLFEQQNYNDALNMYNAIEVKNEPVLLGIAGCKFYLNDYKASIESYKKALDINPKNSDTAYYIGLCYYNLKDYLNAKNYLQKSITLNNENSKAKELISAIDEEQNTLKLNEIIGLIDKKDFKTALNKLNTLISNKYEDAYAYYYRAIIFDELGNKQNAINDYLTSINKNPDLKEVYYSLGVNYDILNQKENAIKYFKEYLSKSINEKNELTDYAQKRINELTN